MHKKLTFALLFISSISLAKKPVSIDNLVEQIKNAPQTREREKAVDDLKKAGIAAAVTIAGGILYPLLVTSLDVAKIPSMETKIGGLPILMWTFFAWMASELAGTGYTAVKSYQGMKHLFKSNHALFVSVESNASTQNK